MHELQGHAGGGETMMHRARQLLNARCVELRARVFEGSNEELGEFNELLAALARMEAGTWGQCAKCGQAIGRDRLRALPETRCCLDCVRAFARPVHSAGQPIGCGDGSPDGVVPRGER